MVKEFHYPLLTDEDFDAKPMVLLIGSYSTGKTSFIRYLLEQVLRAQHTGALTAAHRAQPWVVVVLGDHAQLRGIATSELVGGGDPAIRVDGVPHVRSNLSRPRDLQVERFD